jgi:hypothetical protein
VARLALLLAVLALLAAPAVAAAQTPAPATPATSVRVALLQGEQVLLVDRPGTSLADAIGALVAGPTPAEAKAKVTTEVPAGTVVRGVSIAGAVATVDLSPEFADGNDADALSARIAQLVLTATAFPGVTSVQVLIQGGTPLGLFPGYATKYPLTAADVRDEDVPPPTAPAPAPAKPATSATRDLQQRLAELTYLPAAGVDGKAGDQTRFAVMAFQGYAGLGRDGVAGPRTLAALARATRPVPRTKAPGRRVEVLLDRQIALYIESGRVIRTIHVSTGMPGFATPTGAYTVFRKEQNSWSVPYKVWLPWASYFVGGVAFHQSPDVPAGPASHGCVRVPLYDARWLYERLPNGTRVTVVGRS